MNKRRRKKRAKKLAIVIKHMKAALMSPGMSNVIQEHLNIQLKEESVAQMVMPPVVLPVPVHYAEVPHDQR